MLLEINDLKVSYGKIAALKGISLTVEEGEIVTLVVDTDPQATASRWSEWRGGTDPEIIDCGAPSLLAGKLSKAAELGAELYVGDEPEPSHQLLQ